MAVLENYKCSKCGYSVYADKHGHYTLMMGECYLFRCTTCKEVVEIMANTLDKKQQSPCCPNCGTNTENELYTWNPVEGRCPKCQGKMIEDLDSPSMCAD